MLGWKRKRRIRGQITDLSGHVLNGWAWDPDNEDPVSLEIVLDGVHTDTIQASLSREDLVQAKIGSGKCAFAFLLPGKIAAGSHEIAVHIAGTGEMLAGSPFAFEVPLELRQVEIPQLDAEIEGQIDGVFDGALVGWALIPGQDQPVTLSISLDGADLGTIQANQYRDDLEEAGKGTGYHGFEMPVPSRLPEGLHTFTARLAGGGALLDGSPFAFQKQGRRSAATNRSRTLAAVDKRLRRVSHNDTAVQLQSLPPATGEPRVICYLSVFGVQYTTYFMDIYILSQLARNNLPWLGARMDLIYAICTTRKDAVYIMAHPNYRTLERYCRPIFIFMDHGLQDHISLIEAADAFFALANEAANSVSENTFLILAPDCIWADGAFRYAVNAVAPPRNKRVLLVPHFMRVKAGEADALFASERKECRPIRLKPRTLVRLAREHRHPETMMYSLDSPNLSAAYQSHCLVDVGNEGVAVRAAALHTLAVRLSGPISTPRHITVESLADSDQFSWDDIWVLRSRLLHVDCTRNAKPRNAAARPFGFDDFGWYLAHGTMKNTKDLWKFSIDLLEVPNIQKDRKKWQEAAGRVEAFAEKAVIHAQSERLQAQSERIGKMLLEEFHRMNNRINISHDALSRIESLIRD